MEFILLVSVLILSFAAAAIASSLISNDDTVSENSSKMRAKAFYEHVKTQWNQKIPLAGLIRDASISKGGDVSGLMYIGHGDFEKCCFSDAEISSDMAGYQMVIIDGQAWVIFNPSERHTGNEAAQNK